MSYTVYNACIEKILIYHKLIKISHQIQATVHYNSLFFFYLHIITLPATTFLKQYFTIFPGLQYAHINSI